MAGRLILKGLQWTIVDKVLGMSIQFAFTIFLARILNPEAYGVLGTALIFISIGELFNGIGFSGLLIQKSTTNIHEESTIFWFYILSGLFWTTVFFSTSNLIGDYYDNDHIGLTVKYLSITFLLSSSVQVHENLMIKKFDAKRIFIIKITALVISGLLAIVAVKASLEYKSLIIQYLTKSAITCMLFWLISSWRPIFVFNWDFIKSNRSFGINLNLIACLNYLSRNIDKFLLSRLVGVRDLGLYVKANQFSLIPLNLLYSLDNIFFSTFSHFKEDTLRFQSIVVSFCSLILGILIPVIVFLIINLEIVIDFILGEQWMEIVWPLQMMLIGISVLSFNLVSNTFKPFNELRLELKISVITRTFSVLILVVSSYWGLNGIIYAYVISCVVNTLPKVYFALGLIRLTPYLFIIRIKKSIVFCTTVSLIMVSCTYLQDFGTNKSLIVLLSSAFILIVFLFFNTLSILKSLSTVLK